MKKQIAASLLTLLAFVAFSPGVRAYSAQIDRVYSDDGVTHALLTVTDGELTADAGGIVQGMSGSPIIQDGVLVGAVTHVFVNDPRRGFAVGIYDMLSAAGVTEQAT